VPFDDLALDAWLTAVVSYGQQDEWGHSAMTHEQSEEHSCKKAGCKFQKLTPGQAQARAEAPRNAARAARQAAIKAWHAIHGIEHPRQNCVQGERAYEW